MNVKEDMLKKKKQINEKTEIFIFVFLAFILLITWAMTQPFDSFFKVHEGVLCKPFI